jgi:hypothetical protein
MACGGALDGVIRAEMFLMFKEFFERTDAWLLELPIYIEPNSNDYTLETGQNALVTRLQCLQRPRSPPPPVGAWPPQYLPMCPPQFLPVSAAEGQAIEAQNPAFRVVRAGGLLAPGKCPILRIADNPTANEVWIATLSMNVCDPVDAQGFSSPPDWVVEKWLTYLISGVCMRMMLQPGKPYSSVQGSSFHGRKYNEGIGLARKEVKNMFIHSAQHWRFPSGWNSRSRFFGSHTGYVGNLG